MATGHSSRRTDYYCLHWLFFFFFFTLMWDGVHTIIFFLWRPLQLVVLVAGCPKVCDILSSELVLPCPGATGVQCRCNGN